MVKIFGIEFAPLKIPLHRRLETVGILQYVLSFLTLGFGGLIFMLCLLFTDYYYLVIAYFVWYQLDKNTPERGGRRVESVRSWRVWTWYRDYFPVKLVKTADLDPSKNYLLCVHPHGVLCFGAWCNFATNATGFREMFPGMRSALLILAGHFQFPLYREYVMQTGVCSVSSKSIDYLMGGKHGPGNAAVLLPGGAVEALEARPGSLTINIKRRKGFIRAALRNGVSLVPCFVFGENDAYNQIDNPDGSFLKRLQTRMTKVLGFSMPLFQGRGVFNYTFGILPRRRPNTTIIGKPLPANKIENPTKEEIDDLHEKYIEALVDLFENHKETYGIDKRRHLNLV